MITKQVHRVKWLGSLEEALERAGRESKPVMLDFFSPT
jgi:hypothetical protein